MNRLKILLMIMTLCLSLLVGCTWGSGTALNMKENNNSHRMSATYSKFNGYKKTTLKLEGDEKKTVNVNVETKKGELDLTITHEDGTVVCEQDDLETSTFDVTLDKKGKYTIKVDADNHSGSYDINW